MGEKLFSQVVSYKVGTSCIERFYVGLDYNWYYHLYCLTTIQTLLFLVAWWIFRI
jgi:hypothetical protein